MPIEELKEQSKIVQHSRSDFTRRLSRLLIAESILATLRPVVAFCFLGIAIYAVYSRSWIFLCASFAGTLAVGFLNSSLHHHVFRKIQSIFDSRARIIAGRVLSGTTQKFSLFLRPFSADGGLNDRFGGDDPIPGQFEPSLALAMEAFAPLITVFPQPPEPPSSAFKIWTEKREYIRDRAACYGGGRLQLGTDRWRPVVELLMKEASVVFVVPGHTGGSTWEIEKICSANLLHKTVWIMPPKGARKFYSSDWSKAAEVCCRYGIELPESRRAGRIFTFNPDGTVADTFFYAHGKRYLRHWLLQLLRENAYRTGQEFSAKSSSPKVEQTETAEGAVPPLTY